MNEARKRVAVIGTGYVGLVTGAALAHLGHEVICVDNDAGKVASLRAGKVPIYEPGLAEMMAPLLKQGNLTFTTDLSEAVARSRILFICVGTPMSETGAADMTYVEQVARGIGAAMDGTYRVIVNKSTVPVGTGDWVAMIVQDSYDEAHASDDFPADFDVVSNPEFLREGTAILDTFYPHRVVIGTRSTRAQQEMEELYARLLAGRHTPAGIQPPAGHREPAPFLVTDLTSAEMIKYASNAFLGMKISYINEIAEICEHVGADVTEVARGIGYDRRIGHDFLRAGLGWGGSCFRKDISALAGIAAQYGMQTRLIDATVAVNDDMRESCVQKVMRELKMVKGRTIGLMGLAFKPNTDDLRDAPALSIAARLIEAGARVRAFDPVAMDAAQREMPGIRMATDVYDLARDSDALVLVTDWPQFRSVDLYRLRLLMRTPIFVDGRNMFDPAAMVANGFRYVSFGQATPSEPGLPLVLPEPPEHEQSEAPAH